MNKSLNRWQCRIVFALLATLPIQGASGEANDSILRVLPESLTLDGPESSHSVIVGLANGGELEAIDDSTVKLESDKPTVVKTDGMKLIPVGNGKATITARHAQGLARATVTVTNFKKSHRWSFRHHVQAVFSKLGCNSGACHGALAGKGGFKLSLRGYDTLRDHHTITRQARGRRVELSDPARSLIVAKPSGAIPHKGGLRFEQESDNYRVLTEWISSGAPAPSSDDVKLETISILPERSRMTVGAKQQLVVRAHYSDGRIEDVTRWAKFTSTNEAVARVSSDGLVDVIGHGEGAVTAWFASQIVIARVTSPFANQIPEDVYAKSPRASFIDDLNLAQLQRLNLKPSPRAKDEVFIRRVFIDTIGRLPSVDEVDDFLSDRSHDKRAKLIDVLLNRPEFAEYWAYKWSDVLLINGTRLRPNAVKSYYDWVFSQVKANTPWDEFVRKIIVAQGDTFEVGQTNFYSLHQDPEGMTENVCQAFLGLSIGCAKCHNHPLEKWTNDQYYAMANLFARVRAKGWGGDPRSGDGKRTVFVVGKGDLIQPLTGKPQPPTPLDGQPIPPTDKLDRRVHLAKWLTASDNPYFSRAIANRVWANFMGVGLVEPVDDMRTSNPASNEALLGKLAKFVVAADFDLKQLMRLILNSETYQRSSLPLKENAAEKRFYARYYPKRLMAEVLLDAISQTTDVPTKFDQIVFPGADKRATKFYPIGTRALQLYDSAVSSYFLKTFGRNQRLITCECERTEEASMVQVLHISNGDTINEKLRAKGGHVDLLLHSGKADEKIITQVYLTALSRYPTDHELEQLRQMLKDKSVPRRELIEDLFWAVLSSREFIFNH